MPTPRVCAIAAAGELLDVPVFVMDFVEGSVITESTPAPSNDDAAAPAHRGIIGGHSRRTAQRGLA